jgi:hypothetical protein
MTNIFTQVPANESISTLLELTNTASEAYIVSNENLIEGAYYTVVGKVPYYHGLGEVDFKYSYEDNIVYYVQKYNDRFFKVISKYVCKVDDYKAYRDVALFGSSFRSYLTINKLPLTQVCAKLDDLPYIGVITALLGIGDTSKIELFNIVMSNTTDINNSSYIRIENIINLINSLKYEVDKNYVADMYSTYIKDLSVENLHTIIYWCRESISNNDYFKLILASYLFNKNNDELIRLAKRNDLHNNIEDLIISTLLARPHTFDDIVKLCKECRYYYRNFDFKLSNFDRLKLWWLVR